MIYDNIEKAQKTISSMKKSIDDLIEELENINFPSIISPEVINKIKEDSLQGLINGFPFRVILKESNLSHNYSEVSNIRLTTWTTFKEIEEYFYPSLFGDSIPTNEKSIIFKQIEQLKIDYIESKKNPFKTVKYE